MMLQRGSTIENKQSLLEVLEVQGSLCVRKTAKHGGESDIKAQVHMLSHLPDHLSPHYPKLLAYDIQNPPIWYSMSWCKYPTLRHLLFSTDTDGNTLQVKLNRIIRFLFFEHYEWKTQAANENYLAGAYEHRMRKRLSLLKTTDSFFDDTLLAKDISLDGNTIRPPLKSLDRILSNQTIVRALTPRILHSIHGQMEFDHILVNPVETLSNDFVLLDPRGVLQLGDSAYDVGKIWQSCNTKVDLLEEESYDLKFHVTKDVLVVDHFSLKPSNRFSVCQTLYETARENIKSIMVDKRDDNLLMRSDFAEAVHLCSAVPYYYEGKEKLRRSIACYLLGAVAFDKFVTYYC